MKQRAPLLCLCLLVPLLTFRALWNHPPPPAPPLEAFVPNAASGAEDVFARGFKMSIRCLDLVDLELIPELPVTVAARIAEQRDLLVATPPGGRKKSGFAQVHGVGPRRAAMLDRYVELAKGCAWSSRVH